MKNKHLIIYCLFLTLTCSSVFTNKVAIAQEEKQVETSGEQAPRQRPSTSDGKENSNTSTTGTPATPAASKEPKSNPDDNNSSMHYWIIGGVSGLFHLLEIVGMVWAYKKFTRHREDDLAKIKDLESKLNTSEQNQKKHGDKLKIQGQQLERIASEATNARNVTSRMSVIEQASQQKYGDDSFGHPSNFPNPETVKAAATPSQYPFLETYRQSPDTFKNQYAPKTVSEDAENFNRRWAGNQQEIILGEERPGNYWLFNEGSLTYLIPVPKLKVNDINIRTVGGLFDCNNHTTGYQSMSVIRPAIVSPQPGAKGQWKLEQKGALDFT